MQIKEAALICGLTEKAIRLYEAKGLITPSVTEVNGRKFRDYSDDDIRTLKTIAGLRQSYFTIEQIAEMQSHPDHILAIFAAYKEDLNEKCEVLGNLLDRVDTVDASALSSPTALAAVLSPYALSDTDSAQKPVIGAGAHCAPQQDEVPIDTAPRPADAPMPENTSVPDAHLRVWDEETPLELRDAAHRQSLAYVEQWEKRYARELIVHKFTHRVLIPAVCVVLCVLILWVLPIPYNVDVTYRGYEITYPPETWAEVADTVGNRWLTETQLNVLNAEDLPLPSASKPVTVRLRGTVWKRLFKEDYYIGTVESPDYPIDLSGLSAADAKNEDILRRYNRFRIPLIEGNTNLHPVKNSIHPKDASGRQVFNVSVFGKPGEGDETLIFAVGGFDLSLSTVTPDLAFSDNTFAVFNADSAEEASAIFWEKWWKTMLRDYRMIKE